MSHKPVKRTKKHVEDEVTNLEFKAPESTKTKDEGTKNVKQDSDISNGDESKDATNKTQTKDENSSVDTITSENGDSNLPKRSMQTRSRSNTPLKKNIESTNGIKDDEPKLEEIPEVTQSKETEAGETPDESKEAKTNDTPEDSKETVPNSPSNSVEMDPLILDKDEEEAIPELQFDENDVEVESEGSNSRCKTRRSQSRNVSTPKTPKAIEQEEFEVVDQFLDRGGSNASKIVTSSSESSSDVYVFPDDNTDTQSSISTSNISTTAVAGGDVTRNMDSTGQDSGLFEDNSFSNASQKSFADTLKSLSGRKGIRGTTPNRTDYRKHVLKRNNAEFKKGDHYADYESVQRISLGMKRKSRSFSPGSSKRIKTESHGIFSFIPNPFGDFRKSFKKSSTPKLLTMDTKCTFDDDENLHKITLENGADNEKKWCNVM